MRRIEDIADDHLHTTVSDGDLTPVEALGHLAGRVRGPVSITDHDTLGVHRWPGFADEAARRGVDLVVGIEMDAMWDGIEMHVLGFHVDPEDRPLVAYLDGVAAARRARAREEMVIVNGHLGASTFTDADIFKPGRETLMKPHFIKPLLAKGLFPEYRAALKWYKANVRPETEVAKPPFAEVVRLIRGAGGTAVLAHPGYYVKDHGLPLDVALDRMRGQGLEGVETDYPYHERSRALFTPDEAAAMVAAVGAAAGAAGLRRTGGTDCHSWEDYRVSYPD